MIILFLFLALVGANSVIPPQSRGDIGKLLEKEGHKIGVELGVQHGYFANHILNDWKSCERYYLVDVWAQLENYLDGANVNNNEQEKIYQTCKSILNKYNNKVIYIRNYTLSAASLITEPLDFVYVDARHDYCGTTDDIEVYWPKIKSGGILSGHDYLTSDDVKRRNKNDWSICSNGTIHRGAVKQAVNDFAAKHNLIVTVTQEDWPTWFIRKP